MGVSALRRIQVGKEVTPFTPVPAAYRLVGSEPSFNPRPTFEPVAGWTGAFFRTTGEEMVGRAGEGTIRTPLLRDIEGLLPFYYGLHSAVRTGAATPWTYTFKQGVGSAPVIRTFTAEVGDNNEVIQYIGGICTEFTLEGTVNRFVTIEGAYSFADWSSTELSDWTAITPGTPDYSAPDRRPPVILTNNLKLLVDGTEVGSALSSFSFQYTTGLALTGKVDGTLAQNSVAFNIPTFSASIEVETGVAEAGLMADLESGDLRLFRLTDNVATPKFDLKFVGQVNEAGEIGDRDGQSVIGFTIVDAFQTAKNADPVSIVLETPNSSL